ncbi:MAG: hypothetical protein ACE5F6_07665 [Anaerolineae bacterium]
MRNLLAAIFVVEVAFNLMVSGDGPAPPFRAGSLEDDSSPHRMLLPLLIRLPGTVPIRLHAGPDLGAPVAYTIDNNQVWVGPDTTNPSVFTIDDMCLLRTITNEIQYTFSDGRIYRGPYPGAGVAIYTISEHRVYAGSDATEAPLLSFIGNRTHWGADQAGQVVMTANVPIEGDPKLEVLLPILLLERY